MTRSPDRPGLEQVIATVDLAELFATLNPAMTLTAAVDVICDLERIVDDRARRAIRRLLECRLTEQGLLPERRAA